MKPKTELPTAGSIPTCHEPMEIECFCELSHWIDESLATIEEAFADYVTPDSERRTLFESR